MASLEQYWESISKVVAARRAEMGLSYSDLEKKTGLSYCSLWMYETGQMRNPTLKSLFALCEGLDVTIQQLLGLEPL